MSLQEQLEEILGEGRVYIQEPMSAHTSFRIGGPADYYVQVAQAQELTAVMRCLKAAGEPCYLLGRGTNLLVSDRGYRGCIITQTSREVLPVTDTAAEAEDAADHGGITALNAVQVNDAAGTITAGAGASLTQAAVAARDHGLTGLEFAAGIPGSIGGGLVMNAGAYGGEMKDVVTSVQVLLPDGTERTLTGEEMQFGYRDSIVRHPERLTEDKDGGIVIILGCTMQLRREDPAIIAAAMRELAAKRRDKQPLEYPSAGSTFKRPEGYFAGKLIMDAGLKGYRVGGACVSTKHAGFVVNTDHASAADVLAVIRGVQERIDALYQIHLETEVIFLGEE